MSKIPTAEEFIISNKGFLLTNSTEELNDISKLMIEFTSLHVKAALKEASEKATILENGKDIGNSYLWDAYDISPKAIEYEINKDSILNAYNLENIK